jgi:hypothetical protein
VTVTRFQHDAESTAIMDEACKAMGQVLSDRDLWRSNWRVEVDGCVFKVKIEGYPKRGTPKAIRRQQYLDELSAEADAEER